MHLSFISVSYWASHLLSGMKVKCPINNGSIIQQGQVIYRSRQAEVNNPEVGQRYRTAGRLRVRGRRSGQAGGLRVRTGKGHTRRVRQERLGKSRDKNAG